MENIDLVKISSRFFAEASIKCPASVTAQGAVIAIKCQESGLDPEQLGDALLGDTNAKRRLLKKAINMHRLHGNGPLESNQIALDILHSIIGKDFSVAIDLLSLDRSLLEKITDEIYPSTTTRPREQSISTKVALLIDEATKAAK